MPKTVRVSLANKCQLLFGAAVILIVSTALAVAWLRMAHLVREGQEELAQRVAQLWLDDKLELAPRFPALTDPPASTELVEDLSTMLIDKDNFDSMAADDPFLARSLKQFRTQPDRVDRFEEATDAAGRPIYQYVRAILESQLRALSFEPKADTPSVVDPVEMVLLIRFRSERVQRLQTLNRISIVTAGLVAMLLAIGVFWFITRRIILSPVRVLRDTAEKIAEGDTNIRSDINTGDEFEQLSDMFNTMVGNLNAKEQELRQSNKSLDLRLGELAEHNVALYEANRVKDDFLANVSHELRTPLHGIIGFAEVLREAVASDGARPDEKRLRYVYHIIQSSRRLLDLINDLLELAKNESGRQVVNAEPMSVFDTCEDLYTLMRQEAEKADITLELSVARDIPIISSDRRKVEQIVFNFLSNALKFTPEGGTVTLSARVLDPLHEDGPRRLRLSVTDTGPGIAPDMQEKIYDKFFQIESGETRTHGGTGLGLTISRDLAQLLQGEIELDSDVGRGSTFSLVIPFEMSDRRKPLMPGSSAGQDRERHGAG